jgi:hypothetical protein
MLTENSERRGRVQILEVLGLWTSRETPSESPSVLQLSLVTDIEKFAAELSKSSDDSPKSRLESAALLLSSRAKTKISANAKEIDAITFHTMTGRERINRPW